MGVESSNSNIQSERFAEENKARKESPGTKTAPIFNWEFDPNGTKSFEWPFVKGRPIRYCSPSASNVSRRISPLSGSGLSVCFVVNGSSQRFTSSRENACAFSATLDDLEDDGLTPTTLVTLEAKLVNRWIGLFGAGVAAEYLSRNLSSIEVGVRLRIASVNDIFLGVYR
jgi:hypothetical protein